MESEPHAKTGLNRFLSTEAIECNEFLKKVTKNIEKPIITETIDATVDQAEPAELTIPQSQAASDLLAECRAFYRTPLLESERPACKLTLTKELHDLYERSNDAPLRILREQELLHERGKVYWAHLVEANSLLFNTSNEYTLPSSNYLQHGSIL